jgi:hypothetical protein
METPTLVVSDPPHGEVDLQAVADLLGLDIYVTRLKVKYRAPEILFAGEREEAAAFAAGIRGCGLSVTVIEGATLMEPPWPEPVSGLAFDESALMVTLRGEGAKVPYDTEIVAVACQPPEGFSMKDSVDLAQAVASGHGPTIAEAIQWKTNLDFYYEDGGPLQRISVVPEYSGVDASSLLEQVEARFRRLHLDARLVDVRPRQRFVMGEAGFDADQRKRYSFGTLLLCHVLESISPELRNATQFELGSRLGYALTRQRIGVG